MHVIKKQIFDLQITHQSDAFDLQQQVSSLLWRELLPRMDQLFDELCPENQHIYIDSLTIDLGNVTENDLSSDDFIEDFIAIFRETLTKKIESSDDSIRKIPQQQHIFEQWLQFLQIGFLSSGLKKLPDNWAESVFERLATDLHATNSLRNVLCQTNALKRIIFQQQSSFLQQIIGIYTASKQENLTVFLTILLKFKNEIKLKSTLKNHKSSKSIVIWEIEDERDFEVFFWEWVISEVIIKQQKISSQEILQRFIEDFFATTTLLLLKNWTSNSTQSDSIIQKNILESLLKNNTKMLADVSNNLETLTDSITLKKAQKEIEKRIQLTDNQEFNNNKQPKLKNTDLPINEYSINDILSKEHLLTDYAGVVLVNPFLKELFAKLHFIEANKFISIKAQTKAIHLVHFIASGMHQAPEYEQVLPKILCGMPLDEPLDYAIKLTKKEMKEAENMMQAAVSWWGALGKTSPQGLREGFLKREGKLKSGQLGWELQVQPNTLDIMLQKLPFGWGFGLIKLPWMSKILSVDWR